MEMKLLIGFHSILPLIHHLEFLKRILMSPLFALAQSQLVLTFS